MAQPQIGEPIHRHPDNLTNPELADRLAQLKAHHTIVESNHHAAFDAQQTIRADVGAAEGLLARTKAERRPDRRAIEKQEAEITRLKQQASLIASRSKDTAAKSNAARRAWNHVTDYVVLAGNPVEPRKLKGDPDAVIADIDAETKQVERALPPIEDTIAEAVRQIDAMAEADISVHVDPKGHVAIGWPIQAIHAEPNAASGAGSIPNAVDPRPWIVRHFRDELIASATAAIEAKYGGSEGMSVRDQRQRLDELAAQRLDADRVRCAAIWDSGELNFPPDCDPRAILGVSGPEPRERRN